MTAPIHLMIVAGEVSGDMRAAGVLRAIKASRDAVTCFGIGGDELRREGMEVVVDSRHMAVMGISEVVARYGFFRRVLRDMVAAAGVRKPDAVLLVDYPGFNLRLAARLHQRGIKVLYYVCPQVWAWHRSRIPKMARIIDRLLAIFPFEPAAFEGTGLKVDFVGHPLVDDTRRELAIPLAVLPWKGEPRVALLPGSRAHEVRRILPAMWGAAEIIQRSHPNASFLIAAPSADIAGVARGVVRRLGGGPAHWELVTGRTGQILRQADAAAVASGTATLEAALLRCPTVIAYRTSALTYLLGRMLIRVPYIGIANIIAGRAVCPELIQDRATPAALAEAVLPLLEKSGMRADMLAGFAQVAEALGPGGADARAAEIILRELDKSP